MRFIFASLFALVLAGPALANGMPVTSASGAAVTSAAGPVVTGVAVVEPESNRDQPEHDHDSRGEKDQESHDY